jgi:hypothetical protein
MVGLLWGYLSIFPPDPVFAKVGCSPSYSNFFERLYRDDSLSYRSFLSILALCGATTTNIVNRESDTQKEIKRLKIFIENSSLVLKKDQRTFKHFHKLSIKLWMQDLLDNEDEAKVRRDMYLSSKRMNFNNMYRKLCIEADLDQSLQHTS